VLNEVIKALECAQKNILSWLGHSGAEGFCLSVQGLLVFRSAPHHPHLTVPRISPCLPAETAITALQHQWQDSWTDFDVGAFIIMPSDVSEEHAVPFPPWLED